VQIVIDTNVIVSSYMFPGAIPGAIIEHWHGHAFELLVSTSLIAEYERVLHYPHIRSRITLEEDELARSIQIVRKRGILVEPNDDLRVVAADSDDDIGVATAVAGNADFVVSGDRYLLDLGEHRGIRIIAPAIFLAILEHDL
jgi:uncharacterized protein